MVSTGHQGARPQSQSVQSGPLAAESFPSLTAPAPANFLSRPCAHSPLSCQGTELLFLSQDRHAREEPQDLVVVQPWRCEHAMALGTQPHCSGGHRAYI